MSYGFKKVGLQSIFLVDKEICKKWIGKLVKMKSDDPVVKKNRNSFFRYMLSVMEKAIKDSAYTFEVRICNKNMIDILSVSGDIQSTNFN